MSSRPTDWSPLNLHRDPVPGDPAVVRHAEMKYRRTAEAVNNAANNLARLDMSSNVSERLATVLDQIKKVKEQLNQVESRVAGAALALSQYAPALERAQAESVEALAQAEIARAGARRDAAHRDRVASEYNNSNDPAERTALRDTYDYYNNRVSTGSAALQQARGRLQGAIDSRDAGAEKAISTLASIEQSSPVSDSWLDRLAEFLEDHLLPAIKWIGGVLAEIGKWVWANLDIIAVVIQLVGVILSFTPLAPLGATLITLGTVIGKVKAVIDVATSVIQGFTGEKSWGEVGVDVAIAAASFLLAKGVAKGVSAKLGTSLSNKVAPRVIGRLIHGPTAPLMRSAREVVSESIGDLAAGTAQRFVKTAREYVPPSCLASPMVDQRPTCLDTYRRQQCRLTPVPSY